MKQEHLKLAAYLVGELEAFPLRTWGAAARRLFALHKVRYPMADEPTKAGLDRDFEAFCEIFSASVRRDRPATSMHVLGFDDRWTAGREGIEEWTKPEIWRDLLGWDNWRLRQHKGSNLYRLTRVDDELSYWFLIE